MFGKLLKYEFKATSKKFLPLYIAILIVSIFVNIGINFPQIKIMTLLSVMALIGLVIALVVITLMTVIQRFKNNLLGDEGYLMFTLPVSVNQLILSKLVTSIVWIILSMIVGLLSCLFMAASKDFFRALQQIIPYISEIFAQIKGEYVLWTVLALLCGLMQNVYLILLIYTSLSISQIPAFIKHRGIISFLAFIILFSVINSIVGSVFNGIFGDNISLSNITAVLSCALGINIVFSAIMFTATNLILKKQLNIE